MGITPSSGITRAQARVLINSSIVVGNYTGNGAAAREINIGGRATFVVLLGTDAVADFFQTGLEQALFANPRVSVSNNLPTSILTDATHELFPSANGFTLSATGANNNINLNVYYYVASRVI